MKSFTLIEVVIYSAITTIVLGVIANFAVSFYQDNRYFLDQRQAIGETRQALNTMVKDIREATFSQTGAYPIKSADSWRFRFYKDADDDGVIEEVRIELNGTELTKKVHESETIISKEEILSSFLRNIAQNEPLFRYYNAANQLVANPSVLTDIRVVEISLIVNINPNAPPNELLIKTWVKLRNLK